MMNWSWDPHFDRDRIELQIRRKISIDKTLKEYFRSHNKKKNPGQMNILLC